MRNNCKLYIPNGSKDAYLGSGWTGFKEYVEFDPSRTGDPASIGCQATDAKVERMYYSTDGQRLSDLQRGLNLVYTNGCTVIKIVVK